MSAQAKAIIWLTVDRDAERDQVGQDVEELRRQLTNGGNLSATVGRHLPGALKSGAYSIELAADGFEALHESLDAATVVRMLAGNNFRRHQVVTYDAAATAWRDDPDDADRPCIKRTLLIRVDDDATPDRRSEFQRVVAAMPEHITSIRRWNFATLRTGGPSSYTHVWEQEFDDLSGFTGTYFDHPYHWGVVNSWHDPQFPYAVVDPSAVAQCWYEAERSVLRQRAVGVR